MGNIGDGDVDDEPTVIVRRRIGLGLHGVVVILRVRRINGDERHLPPILAALQGSGLRGIRFLLRLAAEYGRNAVSVNRDQADRAFGSKRAEALDHAAGG